MKLITSSIFIALLATAGMTYSGATSAQEITLQQAKDQLQQAKDKGLVGEQADGYLGVVESSSQAKLIVEQINEARREAYTRIAETNNIAVADVELLAGKRAIKRTQAGHYVKMDGQWQKKP